MLQLHRWTFKLIHAFYISMLALRYRTSKGDRVIWPNQYTWLLQQRLIRSPALGPFARRHLPQKQIRQCCKAPGFVSSMLVFCAMYITDFLSSSTLSVGVHDFGLNSVVYHDIFFLVEQTEGYPIAKYCWAPGYEPRRDADIRVDGYQQ